MPLDVLDGAAGLRRHDVAEDRAVERRRAVGDGKVAPRLVAVEEQGDVEDLAGAVGAVRRQLQFAVGRNVERYFDGVLCCPGGVSPSRPRGTHVGRRKEVNTGTPCSHLPPPRGVPGCGASSTANPGVKICPLDSVKTSAETGEATNARRRAGVLLSLIGSGLSVRVRVCA